MTEKMARTNVLPSDMDARGNVAVWDHGPTEPIRHEHETDAAFEARNRQAEAEAKEWHEKHAGVPQPLLMHSSDANHAMAIEPLRYAMEPHDLDESEIEARVKAIQDKRDAARHLPFAAADRKGAVAELIAERAAEKAEAVHD